MLFCSNCNNILDISKTAPKVTKMLAPDTPTSISIDTPKITKKDPITLLLEKVAKGSELLQSDVKTMTFDEIIHHESYKNLDKTTKKKVDEQLGKLSKEQDASTGAYYVCKKCFCSTPIETKTLITSRASEGLTSNYMNMEYCKNFIYNKALPLTRGYICTNKSCESHKNFEKREAVFYRIGMQTWYTCKTCQTYWKGE
jgi:hypothetical protein